MLLLGVNGGAALRLGAEAAPEYDLKAVLLYNLTQFVDWPANATADAGAPWVIGVLGRDPFGRILDDVVRNETHLNRPIVVHRFRNIEAMENCHILFVSASEAERLPRVMQAIKHRPILSVGDTEGFVGSGGMIQFRKTPNGKIQLRVDYAAVRGSGLTISAKLLRVSEVVSAPPP